VHRAMLPNNIYTKQRHSQDSAAKRLAVLENSILIFSILSPFKKAHPNNR